MSTDPETLRERARLCREQSAFSTSARVSDILVRIALDYESQGTAFAPQDHGQAIPVTL